MKDILIVEDGEQERERLAKLFTDAGYTVAATTSVGEAEECLKKSGFRLAILDIGLGDRSGSYLFSNLRQSGRAANVIVFTGNPSVHLKQRFIAEGAADYIVKASSQAQSKEFLERVEELIGKPGEGVVDGLPLGEFLDQLVSPSSKELFLDMNNEYPKCGECGGQEYVVVFSHQSQMPPEVSGKVVCSVCSREMDPEIG